MKKLKLYRFDAHSSKWMDSYLNSRSQYTYIGGKQSRIFPVARGVLQGSVLGPIIYTLYINEMSDVINQYGTCQKPNTSVRWDILPRMVMVSHV